MSQLTILKGQRAHATRGLSAGKNVCACLKQHLWCGGSVQQEESSLVMPTDVAHICSSGAKECFYSQVR